MVGRRSPPIDDINVISALADIAAAHKLARLIYTMLTKGEEYADQGQDQYEERYRQRVLHSLTQRAAKMGLKFVPIEQPAQSLFADQLLDGSFFIGGTYRYFSECFSGTILRAASPTLRRPSGTRPDCSGSLPDSP